MLKLRDIYNLPTTTLSLTDWVLRRDWFPEIDSYHLETTEVLELLAAENRLEVRQVLHRNIDGRRYVWMNTLWFDGKPVAIVQNAGREGDDHRRRWVTDRESFNQLLAYLLSRAPLPEVDEFADPDEERYEEEVFHFYGDNYAPQFGFQCEPRREDVQVIPNRGDILPSFGQDHYLVQLRKGAPDIPRFIRRGGSVLELVRLLTRDELDNQNPRVNAVNDAAGIDRVYLYKPGVRPPNESVQSV